MNYVYVYTYRNEEDVDVNAELPAALAHMFPRTPIVKAPIAETTSE